MELKLIEHVSVVPVEAHVSPLSLPPLVLKWTEGGCPPTPVTVAVHFATIGLQLIATLDKQGARSWIIDLRSNAGGICTRC